MGPPRSRKLAAALDASQQPQSVGVECGAQAPASALHVAEVVGDPHREVTFTGCPPLGKDTLEVPGHERYGFLELKKPGDAWAVGTYLVKLFITPLGQQSFHAANQVGTMRFTIIEDAAPAGVNPNK